MQIVVLQLLLKMQLQLQVTGTLKLLSFVLGRFEGNLFFGDGQNNRLGTLIGRFDF